jgi:hypothetical protein
MPMNQDQLEYQKRSARLYQERFDNGLREIGVRAPEPVLGQVPNDYRREVLRAIKKNHLQNHELYKLNMRGLPDEVLDNFEPMVINAAKSELCNNDNVPPGELRKVDKINSFGRLCETNFYGESFVKQMNRPGRRVVSFTTDRSKFDAAKGRWFT